MIEPAVEFLIDAIIYLDEEPDQAEWRLNQPAIDLLIHLLPKDEVNRIIDARIDRWRTTQSQSRLVN